MITNDQLYKEGANRGLTLGIYLTAISIFSMMSDRVPLLSIIALPMLLCLPLFYYTLLFAVYKKYGYDARFSVLWMLGICASIGGALICALFTYLYLQYSDPDFFLRSLNSAVEVLKTSPQYAEQVRVIKVTIDGGLIPSPMQYCVEMFMLTVLVGSLLSIVLIPLVKLRKKKQ